MPAGVGFRSPVSMTRTTWASSTLVACPWLSPSHAPSASARATRANRSAAGRRLTAVLRPPAEDQLLQIRQHRPETDDEQPADDEARDTRERADDDVQRPHALRADEAAGAHDRDERVRQEQADDEGEEDHDPGGPGDAGDPREEQRLRARLGADAVDHADAERGARAVLRRMRGGSVLVSVDARLQRVPGVAREIEDEHPAAAQPEVALAAEVLHDRIDHPDAEQHQRDTYDLLEDRVDPVREDGAERERQNSEDQDDRRVTERVERCEADGMPLLVREARFTERVHRARPARRMLVHVPAHLARVVAMRWR